MRRSFLAGLLACSIATSAAIVFGRGGMGGMGGGGGHGNGGPGGRNNQNNQKNQPTAAQQAEQTHEKADKSLDDGFAALKAFDSAAALEDFSDAIQLEPDEALAHIGLGLARAQQGKFAASEAEFSSAMSYARKVKENPPPPAVAQPDPNRLFANQQPDPPDPRKADPKGAAEADLRLATFDLAVAYSRAPEQRRALVLMDRLMTEKKPTDEMMVNAQRSLLAMVDAKTQSSIAALPGMLKNLETANNFLLLAHSPLRRWGVTWMDSNEVTRHRSSRETEPLPAKLPFLLPDDSVLPEGKKRDAELVNPLLPIVMGGSDAQPASPSVESPVAGGASPVAPGAAKTQPSTAPAAGAGPVAATPVPSLTRAPARSAERTVTGAAFAVAPDMLLTVGRLAVGAKSLNVQSADGINYAATLVASDDATGVALIKAEGAHFAALPLAAAAKAGPVSVAAFTRPGVFGPELQVLSGELTVAAGQWSLRVSTHPRSAGSPLLNDSGQVVALLVATRDDTLAKLPVVTIEAVRKFVEGKIPPAPSGAAPAPQQSVLELSAMRED